MTKLYSIILLALMVAGTTDAGTRASRVPIQLEFQEDAGLMREAKEDGIREGPTFVTVG